MASDRGPGLQPSQESSDGAVIYLGGEDPWSAHQLAKAASPFDRRLSSATASSSGPHDVAFCAAPAQRVDDAGKLERGSQKASQFRVALGADAVGGWTKA